MIFGNEPISKVKPNSKKSYSDYSDINTYCRNECDFYIEDIKNEIDLSKAHEAFRFCKKFEQEDQFYKHALKDGYTEAEKVLDDLRNKIEIFKKKELQKSTKENKDRLETSEKSKKIWDDKIQTLFTNLCFELEELHKLPEYRPYLIEKEFQREIGNLSKSAKLMLF